ncbi:MAG: hypothetical protein ACAH80_01115 [Alphaproteobacteria bacterium]
MTNADKPGNFLQNNFRAACDALSSTFRFKEKKLNPLTASLIPAFEKAAAITNPTDRVEAMVLLKEETEARFKALVKPEMKKSLLGVSVVLGAGLMGATPVMVAAGIYTLVKYSNELRALDDMAALKDKASATIAEVVDGNLELAQASPAFRRSLQSPSKPSSGATDRAYKALAARIKTAVPSVAR